MVGLFKYNEEELKKTDFKIPKVIIIIIQLGDILVRWLTNAILIIKKKLKKLSTEAERKKKNKV